MLSSDNLQDREGRPSPRNKPLYTSPLRRAVVERW
jgi:hypothetical protein